MTWIVVACAAVAVVLIALSLRSRASTDPSGEPAAREPRPGEDMATQHLVHNVPDGFVHLRTSIPTEEAMVVHGLLTANGIGAALKPSNAAMYTHTRAQPPTMSVLVSREQVDDAEGLLRELEEDVAP